MVSHWQIFPLSRGHRLTLDTARCSEVIREVPDT